MPRQRIMLLRMPLMERNELVFHHTHSSGMRLVPCKGSCINIRQTIASSGGWQTSGLLQNSGGSSQLLQNCMLLRRVSCGHLSTSLLDFHFELLLGRRRAGRVCSPERRISSVLDCEVVLVGRVPLNWTGLRELSQAERVNSVQGACKLLSGNKARTQDLCSKERCVCER